MASEVAPNVKAVVITSSPAPIPQATSESTSASVPDATPIPNAAPQVRAISASNCDTTSPPLNRQLSITVTIAASI